MSDTSEDLYDRALEVRERVAIQNESAIAPEHSRPALRSALDLIEPTKTLIARITSGAEAPVPTGLSQLDAQLDGGLWPGVHVLVGGTGGGKTQLAMQSALHAAASGVPVAYALFEMSAEIGMLRILGELGDVAWGKLMRGQTTPDERARIEAAYTRVPGALHFEAATPFAWSAANVTQLCAALRQRYPAGPALLIIDYAQLAGDLAEETRQRVMRVAYAAQREANHHRVAALIISSTARAGYGTLADMVKAGGLGDAPGPYGGARRVVKHPHALIGLGKESGELEYSAESVTVLGSGGESEETGRILVAATVKRRTGAPSWCALRFVAGRLREAVEIQRVSDLPTAAESAALDERIIKVVTAGDFTSVDALRDELRCNRMALHAALSRLTSAGRLEPKSKRGPFRATPGGGS